MLSHSSFKLSVGVLVYLEEVGYKPDGLKKALEDGSNQGMQSTAA